MSLENALKLLGVSEGASFDEILRAKNSILATCSDDKAIAKVVYWSYFDCRFFLNLEIFVSSVMRSMSIWSFSDSILIFSVPFLTSMSGT